MLKHALFYLFISTNETYFRKYQKVIHTKSEKCSEATDAAGDGWVDTCQGIRWELHRNRHWVQSLENVLLRVRGEKRCIFSRVSLVIGVLIIWRNQPKTPLWAFMSILNTTFWTDYCIPGEYFLTFVAAYKIGIDVIIRCLFV